MNKRLLLTLIYLLLSVTVVSAQATCPTNVILAFARAGSACLNTGRNQVCHGNGAVSFTNFEGDTLSTQAGNVLSARQIQNISTVASDEYTIALLRLQGALTTNDQRYVTLLTFGDTTLENLIEPQNELLITATGSLNVRQSPADNAPILAQISVRESLTANGRTQGNTWLRVIIPGQNETPDIIGWVIASSTTTTGNLNTLSLVDGNTRYQNAFQSFNLLSGVNDAPCDGAPQSGILLQTPNITTPVTFSINGQPITVAGTAYLQAHPNLIIHVLDGEVITADSYYPAGASIGATYDRESLTALPINNLPVRFSIPAALSDAQLAEARAAYQARITPPTAVVGQPTQDTRCRRVTRHTVDLRAGAGTNFEIINELPANRALTPVLAAYDNDGNLWWQLTNSNWLPLSAVSESGICPEVPQTSYAPPPTHNRLSLETCASTNGAIRAGQTVTLEFVPPAFDSLAEAQQATQIDPGRISVENRSLRITVSRPERIAVDRYVRVWSATWRAESGTFRLRGQRLTYDMICDITVPVN